MPYSPLTFPFRGLDDNVAFGEQRADTTRDAQNVRGVDPVTGRVRGAQRSGLSKPYNGEVDDGNTFPVKDLNLLVYDNKQIDYADQAAVATGEGTWSVTTPNQRGMVQIIMDAGGTLHCLEKDRHAFHLYSSEGVLLASKPIAVDAGTAGSNSVDVMAVDEQGDVWLGVSESPVSGEPSILRYTRTGDTTFELVYSIAIDLSGDPAEVMQIEVKNGRLYAVVHNGTETAGSLSYLMVWDNIYGGTKPNTETVKETLGTNTRARGLAVSDDGDIYVTYVENTTASPIDQFLEKFGPSGDSIFLKDSSVVGGGLGLAVTVSGTKIWTLGYSDGADNQLAVEFLDTGVTATETWAYADAGAPHDNEPYLRIVSDAYGNLHIPVPQAIGGGDEYRIISPLGALELGYPGNAVPVDTIAIPPSNPDYSGSGTEPTRPEFAYIGGELGPLVKLKLVSSTASTGSVRSHLPIAVSNGKVRIWTSGDPTWVAPATGTSTLDTGLGWIMSAVMHGEIFYTDGTQYKVYNPVTDTISQFTATTNGEVPRRCKLITAWNERLVLTRNADDAHNVFMSAKGDAYDWDFSPWTPLTTSALAFNNQESLGPVAGIINTVIPYSDEMLIFGCDHEIFLLNGDPGAGGYLGLISDTTGMSFGHSWAKDPGGSVYFFGAKGGVYRMNPYGEAPVRISNAEGPAGTNIERRLAAINLTTYHVRLVWNWEDDGLMVMLLPFGAGAVVTTNFFWERRTGAWHEDTFGVAGNTVRQPHSMAVLDGDDPDDRVVLFGCEDGFVRKWDRTATDDDGLNIASTVLMGPVLSSSADEREVKFKSLTAVLADDQSGCNYEVLVNDRADVLPVSAQRSGSLQPGRNPTIRLRERGKAAYVRLQDAGPGRWALENIRLEGTPGGRERLRT